MEAAVKTLKAMSPDAQRIYEEPIRPCPRCKGGAIFRAVSKHLHSIFFVGCKSCGLWSMGSEQIEKVMWRWNKRDPAQSFMGARCLFCGSPTQREKPGTGVHCSNCGATLDPAQPRDFE